MRKQSYEAPRAEVIVIETQVVLCASGAQGSNTENITVEPFEFP